MYVLKGFISNTALTDNTPGVVAKLGELSPQSYTFAREKGKYADKSIAPNLILTSFISKDETTNITAPSLISKQILEVTNFIYTITNGAPDTSATMLLENLIISFVGRAENFQCGAMIADGTRALPEWLSWKTDADPAYPDNFIKVWFTDEAFSTQYDEYEIYIVPPTDVLDNFFQSGHNVEIMLTSLTPKQHTQRLQAARQGYPESTMRTESFNYIDPANSSHVVASLWGVLIYGVAGNNDDSIKDAMMNYILANSTHSREDWIKILPDIFKRTEFILIPMWDKIAISALRVNVGIYSPQIKITTALAKAKEVANLYPGSHIDSHLTTMVHPYKSVAILCIGSPDNRDAIFELPDVFPDLIAVASNSVDFNRMEEDTQNWATMLADMLYVAEEMGQYTTVPEGMMKMRRNGILYLAQNFKNINYLVAAKTNFDA